MPVKIFAANIKFIRSTNRSKEVIMIRLSKLALALTVVCLSASRMVHATPFLVSTQIPTTGSDGAVTCQVNDLIVVVLQATGTSIPKLIVDPNKPTLDFTLASSCGVMKIYTKVAPVATRVA